MIAKPNKQVISSMVRLENQDDFMRVMGWLKAELAACDEANRTTTSPHMMHRYQGAALTLEQIIRVASNAREVINRLG